MKVYIRQERRLQRRVSICWPKWQLNDCEKLNEDYFFEVCHVLGLTGKSKTLKFQFLSNVFFMAYLHLCWIIEVESDGGQRKCRGIFYIIDEG
jgi:hypothetical protein